MEQPKDRNAAEDVLNKMNSTRIQKVRMALYLNLGVIAISSIIECFVKENHSKFYMKIPLICSYASFFTAYALSHAFPRNLPMISLIHKEISTLVLFYYALFCEDEQKTMYSLTSALIFIYLQIQKSLNLMEIIQFTLHHLIFSAICAYIFGSFSLEVLPTIITDISVIPLFIFSCMYCDYLKELDFYECKTTIMTYAFGKIQLLSSGIGDGIAILDKNLSTILTNPKMQEITSGMSLCTYISHLEYSGKSTQDNSSLFLVDDISKAFDKETQEISKRFTEADHPEISFGVTKSDKTIDWKGKLIAWEDKQCILIYARDITRLTYLEKESIENQYKSTLLRTVSHELRTPTNAIQSISQVLKEKSDLSAGDKSKVKIIYYSCSYLLCLINDLLDYSQIMAGCLKISCTTFNVIDLAKECLELIESQVGNRPIAIKLIKHTEISQKICNDSNRLKQIILNLMGNALKFTKSGVISIEISEKTSKSISFSIRDTGIGIPSHKISSLFKMFSKIEDSANLNPHGVGLGLHISHMLVNRLGGSGIDLVSKEGVGSTFSFDIAVVHHETSDSSELISVHANGLSIDTIKSYKTGLNGFNLDDESPFVLIVDDTYFNVLAFQHVFELEGIKSEYANNGYEAIEKIKENEYDCVLMDCEMPELDGWATMRLLKAMEAAGEITKLPPVIANTSHNLKDVRKSCIDAGMQDIITKPCPRETLTRTIRYWSTQNSYSFENSPKTG